MSQVGGPETPHKFFRDRLPFQVDLGSDGVSGRFREYANVPPSIGTALSVDKSLIVALKTTMNVEALWDVLEVILVDAHNARVLQRIEEERARGR